MTTYGYDKIVVVTRQTELEALIQRFNTEQQARFYLEHSGQDFDPVAARHRQYHRALNGLLKHLPGELKLQVIERKFLPQFHFGAGDFVITVGIDGLVVNTAKYLDGQPIFAFNPDPQQIDGVLLAFDETNLAEYLQRGLTQTLASKAVTLAQASLNDGQTLLAFNDLFIGRQSHVSAQYDLHLVADDLYERQSSSGMIVSTGAGSSGWLKSVLAGASAVIEAYGGPAGTFESQGKLAWDEQRLIYAVREPFASKATGIEHVFGEIRPDAPLQLISQMAEGGVIFSDGIEADYLAFNAGTTVEIGLAERQACLLAA
jgi:NAD kinase